MKIKTTLFILIFLVIFTSGCTVKPGENKTPSPSAAATNKPLENPGDFFPLNNGSYWSYLGEGNEYASFTREVIFTEGSFAQYSESNGGTVSSSVYLTTSDEIKCTYFKGEEYNKENLIGLPSNCNVIILKAPLEVGNTWSSGSDTREIISINASVTTSLGEMTDCILVKITDENSYTYEYFKKDIGLVKREFHSDETVISSTLEEMNLSN